MATPSRMPAEWEPHAATWLAWPYGDESFAERIPAVEAAYIRMVRALAAKERVKLVVLPSQKSDIETKLTAGGVSLASVDLIEADYADVWMRDWGPTFLSDKVYVKWNYNAYGNKFPALLKDDTVVPSLSALAGYERRDAGFVMEGGAVETNGAGVILTTEETLLNPNRNPGMSKDETEERLKELLGAKVVVWLKQGLVNDHTDGHIDEIARFTDQNTIFYAWENEGENHDRMAENLLMLEAARTADGNPFTLLPLPLPKMYYGDGERAPASYCNFYLANGVVLVPEFGDANDAPAKEAIGRAFPGREIVDIPTTDLVYGGGGVHCVTQQEPA